MILPISPTVQNKQQRLSALNMKAAKGTSLRFGQQLNLPVWLKAVDSVMKPVQQTRFREMMFEDIFGFAIPRTSMDLSRQYLFNSTYDNKRELNVAAGRERFMMEIMGFMQWWVALVGNLAAVGLAKKTFGLSKQHLSYESSDFIQYLLNNSQNQVRTAKGLLHGLAQQLAPQNTQAVLSELKPFFANSKLGAEQTALNIAKLLKQQQLDWHHAPTGVHALPKLLDELRGFSQSLQQGLKAQPSRSAGQVATQLLQRVNHLKGWSIPMVMGLGVAYNFFSPIIIHKATTQLDKIQDYPGEKGLRPLKMVFEGKMPQDRPDQKTLFPYLKASLKQGNIWPAVVSLLPLPLVMGFFNTQKIATMGWQKAWTKPFTKGFGQRYLRLFQLGKGFPFATSQQISSIYAGLILSRIATSRDSIEFRERTIDAFLGWGIWMLATPWIKTKLAKRFDATGKTKLLKMLGDQPAIRTEQELLHLVNAPKRVIHESIKRLKIVNYGALASTLVLLGLVEPYVAIKLTEMQANKQRKAAGVTTGI